MADPPASAPRMCEHTRGSGAGISKSARLRSATAPRMCERSFMGTTVKGKGEKGPIVETETNTNTVWLLTVSHAADCYGLPVYRGPQWDND